eukprot:COSAG06_NODE_25463_length_636_cov_0.957169_1_plen_151_part_10
MSAARTAAATPDHAVYVSAVLPLLLINSVGHFDDGAHALRRGVHGDPWALLSVLDRAVEASLCLAVGVDFDLVDGTCEVVSLASPLHDLRNWSRGSFICYYCPVGTGNLGGGPECTRIWCNSCARSRTLGAMCEILQCGGGVEELLAEPCV